MVTSGDELEAASSFRRWFSAVFRLPELDDIRYNPCHCRARRFFLLSFLSSSSLSPLLWRIHRRAGAGEKRCLARIGSRSRQNFERPRLNRERWRDRWWTWSLYRDVYTSSGWVRSTSSGSVSSPKSRASLRFSSSPRQIISDVFDLSSRAWERGRFLL